MRWLDKLERKYGKFAIRGLMTYIVGLSAGAYIFRFLFPDFYSKIELVPSLVFKGEVWRLITYIFIPPDNRDILLTVIALYFYYFIGSSLESEWGSFAFNIYYLLGMVGTTIAAFITGRGTSAYLNLSLFLAFAYLFPEHEVLIFYIIPVKVKWLGWLYWAIIIFTVFTAPVPQKAAAVASVLNFLVFFGKEVLTRTKTNRMAQNNRRRFKAEIPKNLTIHRCSVCGITEKDNPDMEFRYCVECNGGDYEYCMEHLKDHKHIKKVVPINRDNE